MLTNRQGSDGSGFALGVNTARGTPLDKVNFVSTAGTLNPLSAQPSNIKFDLFFKGYGIVTFLAADCFNCRCYINYIR